MQKAGSLWQYYRDEPALTSAGMITNFSAAENSAFFKFKKKQQQVKQLLVAQKIVEIIVQLKYLSNFWRTLKMPLINCEINLIWTWSEKCVLSNDKKAIAFAITDKRLYVPVATLSTQDNEKLLQQLKSGFKRTINWNIYQSKVAIQAPNPYLDYLIDSSFQGVNQLFVLLFENKDDSTVHTKYYLQTVEIKDCNVMINGQNFLDQLVKNYLRTYDNIQKIAIGQGDYYTTDCLLDYNYFNDYYKMIAIDLSKQHALDADPKAIN